MSSKISEADFAAAFNDTSSYPTLRDVADHFGISRRQAKHRVEVLRVKGKMGLEAPALVDRKGKQAQDTKDHPNLEIQDLPGTDEAIEDLVARAMLHNERNIAGAEARRLVEIKVKIDGPYGVAGIPDPHLNNPGTMLRKAFDDAYKIRDTEGLFCVGIGDWLDNFIIGRLERERRHDIMTHTDAVRIQEHYVLSIMEKMIAAIGGNHNDWPTMLGGEDALGKMFNDKGLGSIYHPDQVRVRLTSPNGRQFIHLARHIFPGHSKYHPTHGILVWLLERWMGENVAWGGHIHTSGYISLERRHTDGDSMIAHGIQLAAYKKEDGYAMKKGFRENINFVTPVIIHDPAKGKTFFFPEIDDGIDFLKFLRSKK